MKSLQPIHNDIRTPELTSHPDYYAWMVIGARQQCLDAFSQSLLSHRTAPGANVTVHQTLVYVHSKLQELEPIEPGKLARACAQRGEDFPSVLAQQVGYADGKILAYVVLLTELEKVGAWRELETTSYNNWDSKVAAALSNIKSFWIRKGGRPADVGPREALAHMAMIANWELFPKPVHGRPLDLVLSVKDIALPARLAHQLALLQLWDELESVGGRGWARIAPETKNVVFDLNVGMDVIGAVFEKARQSTWLRPYFGAIAPKFTDLEESLYRRYAVMVDLAINEYEATFLTVQQVAA